MRLPFILTVAALIMLESNDPPAKVGTAHKVLRRKNPEVANALWAPIRNLIPQASKSPELRNIPKSHSKKL